MDLLSHLFLPITAVFVVRRELFDSPWLLGLAGFGLLPDFDKFLGTPGLLHSLVTLAPLSIALLALEYRVRDELNVSPVIVALIGSHLLLDFLDGGPVPLLYPVIDAGLGLQYPARTIFGEGPLWLEIHGPIFSLRTVEPRPDNRTYGFIKGAGVASMLLFSVIYASDRWQTRVHESSESRVPPASPNGREPGMNEDAPSKD